ncbi:MAG: rod shape-determining protein MreD [Lachnospiraceae bacterium]|nr:rod shape-determining protein MreD [Lachnospiraceae bacterium]
MKRLQQSMRTKRRVNKKGSEGMLHKIKSIVVIALLIIVSFILQNTISVITGDLMVTPNLLIILVCVFGYLTGSNEAMVIGFFCGLLVDSFSSDIIGLNSLLYLYVGFFSGSFHRLFYKNMVMLPLAIVAAGDFIYNFGYYIIRFMLRNKLDVGFYLFKIIIPELVITVCISLLVYRFIYKVYFAVLISEEQRSKVRFD